LKQIATRPTNFNYARDIALESFIERQLIKRSTMPETLSASDAIILAVTIVTEAITYNEINSHAGDITPDIALIRGLGDCDKYADGVILIFNYLKKRNSNLRNIFITR